MGFYRKWKPSKTQAKEFAQTMEDIRTFCDTNLIDYSTSMDSYYFTINGQKYRVSNHTIAASDRGMYRDGIKVRDSYHNPDDDLICITASKTRIKEIYEKLEAGLVLDKRGYIKRV